MKHFTVDVLNISKNNEIFMSAGLTCESLDVAKLATRDYLWQSFVTDTRDIPEANKFTCTPILWYSEKLAECLLKRDPSRGRTDADGLMLVTRVDQVKEDLNFNPNDLNPETMDKEYFLKTFQSLWKHSVFRLDILINVTTASILQKLEETRSNVC